MPTKQDIKVAVDAVVFGYTSKEGLSILLIKRNIEPFKNSWALPGGLVGKLRGWRGAQQAWRKTGSDVSSRHALTAKSPRAEASKPIRSPR